MYKEISAQQMSRSAKRKKAIVIRSRNTYKSLFLAAHSQKSFQFVAPNQLSNIRKTQNHPSFSLFYPIIVPQKAIFVKEQEKNLI